MRFKRVFLFVVVGSWLSGRGVYHDVRHWESGLTEINVYSSFSYIRWTIRDLALAQPMTADASVEKNGLGVP